jgi:hypothetical protein
VYAIQSLVAFRNRWLAPGSPPALNAAEKELAALNHKLAALKRQKKGLMQQLLTGKVRVAVDCKK